jgi:hypothetical protein
MKKPVLKFFVLWIFCGWLSHEGELKAVNDWKQFNGTCFLNQGGIESGAQ